MHADNISTRSSVLISSLLVLTYLHKQIFIENIISRVYRSLFVVGPKTAVNINFGNFLIWQTRLASKADVQPLFVICISQTKMKNLNCSQLRIYSLKSVYFE